jgi:peptide/nickel transport system ATP-binding protein
VERLRPIEGSVPDALSFPPGCRFHPRCRYAFEPCRSKQPQLLAPRDDSAARPRYSACFRTEQDPDVSYLEAPASARGGAL